jgi:hypothetical protein
MYDESMEYTETIHGSGGVVLLDSLSRVYQEVASSLDTQIGGNHYKNYPIQPIEFFIANQVPYAEAAVIKYVLRYKNKNGKEDLQKAKHIIDILIEENYGDKTK